MVERKKTELETYFRENMRDIGSPKMRAPPNIKIKISEG